MTLRLETLFEPEVEPTAELLLLHGFMGDSRDWQHFAAALRILRPDLRLLALDLPGHGQAASVHCDSFEVLVAELVAVIEARLKRLPLDVVGYSMGGRVAGGIVCAQPSLFHRAVFVSSSFGLPSQLDRSRRLRSDAKLLQPVIEARLSWREFLEGWYSQPLFIGLNSLPSYGEIIDRRASQSAADLDRELQSCLGVGVMPDLTHRMVQRRHLLHYVFGELDMKYRAYAKTHSDWLTADCCTGASHNIVATHWQWLAGVVAQQIT